MWIGEAFGALMEGLVCQSFIFRLSFVEKSNLGKTIALWVLAEPTHMFRLIKHLYIRVARISLIKILCTRFSHQDEIHNSKTTNKNLHCAVVAWMQNTKKGTCEAKVHYTNVILILCLLAKHVNMVRNNLINGLIFDDSVRQICYESSRDVENVEISSSTLSIKWKLYRNRYIGIIYCASVLKE